MQGVEPDGVLRRLLDKQLHRVNLPEDGILLTDHLAKMLAIRPGQLLTVELLEGSRAVREIPVTEMNVERKIRLVFPARRNLSHAAKAFLELVQKDA